MEIAGWEISNPSGSLEKIITEFLKDFFKRAKIPYSSVKMSIVLEIPNDAKTTKKTDIAMASTIASLQYGFDKCEVKTEDERIVLTLK